MAVIVNGSEIVLSGMVGGSASGDSWFDPPGFASEDVIKALAEVGRDTAITVRLNSGGGIATEGAAIHAALSQHKGPVQVVVEGIAASAASLIAMAADTLTIAKGAVFMIHETSGYTMGNAAAHEATIKVLNSLNDAYAGVYADRTGKDVAEVRDLMRAETWLTGPEAVAMGFADALASSDDDEDDPVNPTAFDYSIYARTPDRLLAMANANGWRSQFLAHASKAPPQIVAQGTSGGAGAASAGSEGVGTGEQETAAGGASEPDSPVAIAAELGAAGFTAEQIVAFVSDGGTLERARQKVAEAGEIREVIDAACRANAEAVSLTFAQAMARNLSLEEVRAAVGEQVAKQEDIDPQVTATPEPQAADVMMGAVARINASIRKGWRR